jgi:hypothetical protein
MKNLYIHCDGGFGNRFNSLIVGLLISEVGNYNPIISWPSTNVCRAKYFEIFEDSKINNSDRLEEYIKSIDDLEFVMHEDQLSWGISYTHPNSFISIDDVVNLYNKSSKSKLFYFNNLIPDFAKSSKLLSKVLTRIKFKQEFINEVEEFIEKIGSPFIGVHLRATDFSSNDRIDFKTIYEFILNNDHLKFFVCSDSKDLENKFSKLENVIVKEKKNYVEKIEDTYDWRGSRGFIQDEYGKNLSFNVERSNDSVKEAIIDLLILSKSDILKTSNSTFLETAILLKDYG